MLGGDITMKVIKHWTRLPEMLRNTHPWRCSELIWPKPWKNPPWLCSWLCSEVRLLPRAPLQHFGGRRGRYYIIILTLCLKYSIFSCVFSHDWPLLVQPNRLALRLLQELKGSHKIYKTIGLTQAYLTHWVSRWLAKVLRECRVLFMGALDQIGLD